MPPSPRPDPGEPGREGPAGRVPLPESTLCHCFRITHAALRRMVAERGLTTVEEVAELTGACRGCQTCRPDIEAVLREPGRGTAPLTPGGGRPGWDGGTS